MLTTRKEIIELFVRLLKTNRLPANYADYVHIGKGGMASVRSFSGPGTHTVHIERWGTDDQLKVDCSCPAIRPCRHVSAFYAVAKGIEPNTLIEEELAIQMSFDF